MDSLAPELLLEIFGNIEITEKKTLSAIVYTCKLFYDIAGPQYFANVNLSSNADFENGDTRLRSMIVACQQRSRVAACVKHFTLRTIPHLDLLPLQPEAFSQRSLENATVKSDLSQREFLELQRAFTSDPKNDAILSVILPLLPNLETLDLEFNLGMPGFLDRLFEAVAGNAIKNRCGLLTKLHSVVLIYSKGTKKQEHTRDWGPMIFSLLSLPSIKSLYLRKVHWKHMDEDEHLEHDRRDWESSPGADDLDDDLEQDIGKLTRLHTLLPLDDSGITHLDMRDCLFRGVRLASILWAPKALESFVWVVDARQGFFGPRAEFVVACLEHQADSLQRLYLDLIPLYCGAAGAIPISSQPLSFEKFEQLRHLRIPLSALTDEAGNIPKEDHHRKATGICLPSSIIKVHLTYCDNKYLATQNLVNAMLSDVNSSYLPHLKTIILETKTSDAMHAYLIRSSTIRNLPRQLNVDITLRSQRGEMCERRWGVDDEVEWAPCSDRENRFPAYVDSKIEPEHPTMVQEEDDGDSDMLD